MKKTLKRILYIIFAVALISISVNIFLGPHKIAAGGITGLAIILEELLSVQRSVVILVANGAVLILALIFLGREIFLNTVIGALLLPIFIGIVPQVTLVQDTMLSMVVGSVIFGIAVSILYRNNASSGGTAVPPLILKKYFNLSTSVGLFITDGVVVVLSLFVFGFNSFFYAIASIFITSVTMTYIESGINKKKLVYIISDMASRITDDILHDVGRGVTVVPVIGAHENTERSMLMVTLDNKDYRQLVTVVNKHDEGAFMITDTVSDVHGRGFTYESGSV